MDLLQAIETRHSVRSYTEQKIEGEVLAELQSTIAACNAESGLHIQLCLEEPKAFSSLMARYGRFVNVHNYIALVGKKGPMLEEQCGYYGEKIVLRATQLGLGTCWVAATYGKGKCPAVVHAGEKLLMVISIGYGATQGVPHKGKPLEELYRAASPVPEWFLQGVRAAQLAPTATNQQKFLFSLNGDKVRAEALSGFYAKTDLGIVKAHFEVGAQGGSWQWQA